MSAFEVIYAPSRAELECWDDVTNAHGETLVDLDSNAWRRTASGAFLALTAGLVCVGLGTTIRHGGFLVVLLVLGGYFAGQISFARATLRLHRELRRIECAEGTMVYAERRCRIDAAGLSMRSEGFTWSVEWHTVKRASAERGLLMFWITATQTQFIPIRAFDDADEARAILIFAQDRIGTARESTEDSPAP